MDQTDDNDQVSGIDETSNFDIKPSMALINQDVMLSGATSQPPIVPTSSISNHFQNTLSVDNLKTVALGENIFLSIPQNFNREMLMMDETLATNIQQTQQLLQINKQQSQMNLQQQINQLPLSLQLSSQLTQLQTNNQLSQQLINQHPQQTLQISQQLNQQQTIQIGGQQLNQQQATTLQLNQQQTLQLGQQLGQQLTQQQTNQLAQQLLLGLNNNTNQNLSQQTMQHIIIPVSATGANGVQQQQLVSIPISLAGSLLGNQMQLLTGGGGQLLATNLGSNQNAGLLNSPQINLSALQNKNTSALPSIIMLGSQLGVIMPQVNNTNQSIQNLAIRQLIQQQQDQQNNQLQNNNNNLLTNTIQNLINGGLQNAGTIQALLNNCLQNNNNNQNINNSNNINNANSNNNNNNINEICNNKNNTNSNKDINLNINNNNGHVNNIMANNNNNIIQNLTNLNLSQLIANGQNQLLALATPQQLLQQLAAANNTQLNAAKLNSLVQQLQLAQQLNLNNNNNNNQNNQNFVVKQNIENADLGLLNINANGLSFSLPNIKLPDGQQLIIYTSSANSSLNNNNNNNKSNNSTYNNNNNNNILLSSSTINALVSNSNIKNSKVVGSLKLLSKGPLSTNISKSNSNNNNKIFNNKLLLNNNTNIINNNNINNTYKNNLLMHTNKDDTSNQNTILRSSDNKNDIVKLITTDNLKSENITLNTSHTEMLSNEISPPKFGQILLLSGVNGELGTPAVDNVEDGGSTMRNYEAISNGDRGGNNLVSSSCTSGSVIVGSHTLDISNAINVVPNIKQLLPELMINQVGEGSASGTVVDGVNLDEMREFAKYFKIRRLSLGLTQTQVGQALSVTEGPSYSQSAICRFEKLDITPKSAQKIKPVLERWISMAEERYKNGIHDLTDLIGLESSKKRKRRTSFTPQALEYLNEHFEHSSHPSGSEMTELANKLNFEREVIRVWFCNKRQTLKNTIKKLKAPHSPDR